SVPVSGSRSGYRECSGPAPYQGSDQCERCSLRENIERAPCLIPPPSPGCDRMASQSPGGRLSRNRILTVLPLRQRTSLAAPRGNGEDVGRPQVPSEVERRFLRPCSLHPRSEEDSSGSGANRDRLPHAFPDCLSLVP